MPLYMLRLLWRSDQFAVGVQHHDYLVQHTDTLTRYQGDYLARRALDAQARFQTSQDQFLAWVLVPVGRGIEAAYSQSWYGYIQEGTRGSIFWEPARSWRISCRIRLKLDSTIRSAWVFPAAYPANALVGGGNNWHLNNWNFWSTWQLQVWYDNYPQWGKYVRAAPTTGINYDVVVSESIHGLQYQGITLMNKNRRMLANRSQVVVNTALDVINIMREIRYRVEVTNEYAHLALGDFYLHSFNERLSEQISFCQAVITKMEKIFKGDDGFDASASDPYYVRFGPTREQTETVISRLKKIILSYQDLLLHGLDPDSNVGGVDYYRQNKAMAVYDACVDLAQTTFPLLWFDFWSTRCPGFDAKWGGYIPLHPDLGP
jgi:hypothetical protein